MSTFTEESIIDRVEAQWIDPIPGDPDNDVPPTPGRFVINVRRSNRVLQDGAVIASRPHRHVVELTTVNEKGEPIPADLTDQDPIVQKIAAAVADGSTSLSEATRPSPAKGSGRTSP